MGAFFFVIYKLHIKSVNILIRQAYDEFVGRVIIRGETWGAILIC